MQMGSALENTLFAVTREARVTVFFFSHYHFFSSVKTCENLEMLYNVIHTLTFNVDRARPGHSFLACNLLWPNLSFETSDTELDRERFHI